MIQADLKYFHYIFPNALSTNIISYVDFTGAAYKYIQELFQKMDTYKLFPLNFSGL